MIYDSVIKLFLSIEGLQSLLSLLSGMYRTSLSTSVGSNTSSVQSPQTLVHYVLLNYKLFRAFIILRVCLFLRLACIHRFKLAMNITEKTQLLSDWTLTCRLPPIESCKSSKCITSDLVFLGHWYMLSKFHISNLQSFIDVNFFLNQFSQIVGFALDFI